MSSKRPAEDPISVQRRTRIKLSSPSPEETSESDVESVYGHRRYRTKLANDTSGTSTLTQMFPSEYETANQDEQLCRTLCSSNTSLKIDVQNKVGSSNSIDKGMLADISEENSTSPSSNSDVDPGLPRNDYLDFEKCLLCQTDKKNISFPYCSTCFTKKKILGLRGSKKRRKKLKGLYDDKSLTDWLFEDSGIGSAEPQLSEDTVDGSSHLSTNSAYNESSSQNLCRICFLEPENGIFVHLNIAHRYGCYSCAKEIWYHDRNCPLCRRRVFKVAKLFV